MKLAKRFAALIMGATLALGSIAGLAGCGESAGAGAGGNNAGSGADTNNTQSGGVQTTVEDQIRAIYDLYAANCAENNVTPQTYEEWLDLIKGEKGDPGEDGKSAYELYVEGYKVVHDGSSEGVLTEAEWLASLKGAAGDTGETGATGPQGKSAYDLYVEHYIEENGGEEGVLDEDAWLASLKGEKGDRGSDGQGQRGTRWHFGETGPSEPTSTEITRGTYIAGDFYLDITTWRVFILEHTIGYHWRELGQIKGVGGGQAEEKKYEYELDIAANDARTISISGLAPGPHLVLLDTGVVQKSKISDPPDYTLYQWKIKVGNAGYYSLLARNGDRSSATKYEICFGFINVHQNDTTAIVETVNEKLKGTLTIEEEVWEPDFSAWNGTSIRIDMPVNGYRMNITDGITFTYPDWFTDGRWTASYRTQNDIAYDKSINSNTTAKAQFFYLEQEGNGGTTEKQIADFVGNFTIISQPADAFASRTLTVNVAGKTGFLRQTQQNGANYASSRDIWPITLSLTKNS